jgi:hypothetical protein
VQAIVDRCQHLFDDLDFNAVKEWKAAVPGRKAIGYMPVYVPRELVHAAGMLPVGILGGGDAMEVIQGDAYYQSYICRIPRSTLELGLTGKLDCLDGMLFPSICDVIRNLSGMWQILFKDKYVKYFDVPQNYVDEVGGNFYIHEMQALREDLGRIRARRSRMRRSMHPSASTTTTARPCASSMPIARSIPGRRRPRRSTWCSARAWCCRRRSTPPWCARTSPPPTRCRAPAATTRGWCSPAPSASSRRWR